MVKEHGTNVGSLVAAMMNLLRTSNGTIIEPWENVILCSNPKGGMKVGSEVVDGDGRKSVQGDASVGNQSVGGWLPVKCIGSSIEAMPVWFVTYRIT